MVLYVTSQDCTRGAGSMVVVTLRPGNGSDGASHGLWRYVCCQKRPTMTLPSCRYTGVMAVSGYCTCVYLQDISRLLKKSYQICEWMAIIDFLLSPINYYLPCTPAEMTHCQYSCFQKSVLDLDGDLMIYCFFFCFFC